jgi:23S rRNA (pseudouridine1915-N3)-methyltransferase
VRLALHVIGHMKTGPERDLVNRYIKRFTDMAGSIGMEYRSIVQTSESKAKETQTRKRDEAKALLPQDYFQTRVIAFDEGGVALSSIEFADLLAKWRDEGTKNLILIIGGADGLHDTVREKASRIISFGAMTLPHQLVRVLALEQLYRAATILSHHPYHR